MANPEHLKKLQEGVEAWNKWRKDNSDIRPDLNGANLYGASLRSAKLHNVKLHGADLHGASLRSANLIDANLNGAYLEGADLHAATLKMAQALHTNFKGANFTGACIKDWHINSKTNLENVQCDYIFLKEIYLEDEIKWVKSDRIPHDPDKIFAPGEFTKRYQKILKTVDLYFGEGIDWQVFLQSFQKLQEEEKLKIQNGDQQIPIVQGIKNTGDGSYELLAATTLSS